MMLTIAALAIFLFSMPALASFNYAETLGPDESVIYPVSASFPPQTHDLNTKIDSRNATGDFYMYNNVDAYGIFSYPKTTTTQEVVYGYVSNVTFTNGGQVVFHFQQITTAGGTCIFSASWQ